MEGTALVGVLFRVLSYSFLFYCIGRWSWGEACRFGFFGSIGLATLRLGFGVATVFLLGSIAETWPSEVRPHVPDLLFVARLILWTGMLGFFAGARTLRLAVGVFFGMLLHLTADFLFAETKIGGIPLFG